MPQGEDRCGVVDTSARKASTIILERIVIRAAKEIPSRVATKGPILHTASPLTVNGRKNHRKRIRPFTISSLTKTFLRGSPARKRRPRANTEPGRKASQREETATTTENRPPAISLSLGSRR